MRLPLLAVGLALLTAGPTAWAQAWPTKQPIKLVAVFPPGGSVDQVARILAYLDGAPPRPTIFMGDLNEWLPSARCLRRLFAQGVHVAKFPGGIDMKQRKRRRGRVKGLFREMQHQFILLLLGERPHTEREPLLLLSFGHRLRHRDFLHLGCGELDRRLSRARCGASLHPIDVIGVPLVDDGDTRVVNDRLRSQ